MYLYWIKKSVVVKRDFVEMPTNLKIGMHFFSFTFFIFFALTHIFRKFNHLKIVHKIQKLFFLVSNPKKKLFQWNFFYMFAIFYFKLERKIHTLQTELYPLGTSFMWKVFLSFLISFNWIVEFSKCHLGGLLNNIR